MEVQKEAQRIMTLSVWKMYHSRLQRGGLRLHRSLQLSLVMRSARELYLSAKVEAQEPEVAGRPSDPRLLLLASPPATEAAAAAAAAAGTAEAAPPDGEPPSPEPMDTEDNKEEEAAPRPARASRKRRSSSRLNDGGLVPSKKARLEEEEEEEEEEKEEEGMVVAAAAEEEEEEEAAARLQPAAPAEGAFPNLARVLQRSFSGLLHRSPGGPPTAAPAPCEATPACRPPDSMLNVLVRAVVAF